jgi:hypothetical protein
LHGHDHDLRTKSGRFERDRRIRSEKPFSECLRIPGEEWVDWLREVADI